MMGEEANLLTTMARRRRPPVRSLSFREEEETVPNVQKKKIVENQPKIGWLSRRLLAKTPKRQTRDHSTGSHSTAAILSEPLVSFGSILIREYELTLGDNPSCSHGAPLQLDWAYQESTPVAIDCYELNRCRRRTAREMCLSSYARCEILNLWGFSSGDIRKAVREVSAIRRQRLQTEFFLPVSRTKEVAVVASSKLKRVFQVESEQSSV